jgi:formylglycine-generating enzyme required for sulfatase activity
LVTQEQWQAVMGDNPSKFKGAKNPVERVSWDDCQEFLKRLNVKSRHGGGMFRLPTVAQWEYACRAGSTSRHYFGNDEDHLGEYAWYRANSGSRTHPVGEKKPNAWGLLDMYGNVREWCQDWYDEGYYANSPADDPTGPASGSHRVTRGGSWNAIAGDCCSASCRILEPGHRSSLLGFRVARGAE